MGERSEQEKENLTEIADVSVPLWVPVAAVFPSCRLSAAKPAWLSGGTAPAKAPVDGEGMSAEGGGWLEVGVAKACGEDMDL